MALTTVKIEVRFDYDSKEKNDIIIAAAKDMAKMLFTQASLIADRRKPSISLECGDLFVACDNIALADCIDHAEATPPEPPDVVRDTSCVLETASLDASDQQMFSKPWLFQCDEGIHEFDTQGEAETAQRGWRKAHGFDETTGEKPGTPK
jgi:hypothetical protein